MAHRQYKDLTKEEKHNYKMAAISNLNHQTNALQKMAEHDDNSKVILLIEDLKNKIATICGYLYLQN